MQGTAGENDLRPLFSGRVAEEEIDHLGHMNVRFYLAKALAATHALAAAHGLGPDACRQHGAQLFVGDLYTRHYREQLAGAPLVVRGGVLGAHGQGLRFYHELANGESGEIAATFVHEVELVERGSRRPLPIPELVAKSASEALVAWPEHGRPRSIDLERTPPTLSLEQARARGLEMREPRRVTGEECDAAGVYDVASYQDLFWGGEPLASRGGGPLVDMGAAGSFGWATLESRGRLLALPRAGDRIQSFGAEIEIGAKTSFRHHWVFDVDRGTLLCTSSGVNLAFDLTARRAIEIPEPMRAMLQASFHPDLA